MSDATLPTSLNFQIVPEEGSFIGFKKITGGCLVKLRIPIKAKRTSTPIGRKCRAEYVQVLEISTPTEVVISNSRALPNGQVWKVGTIIRPDSYDPDPRIECTNGIHFFLTRKEAEEYCL